MEWDTSLLCSGIAHIMYNLTGETILTFQGPATHRPTALSDAEEPVLYKTYVEKEPMVHFLAEHFNCSLRETRLYHRLLMSIIAEKCGNNVSRMHTQLLCKGGCLSISTIKHGLFSSLIYAALFIEPHPEYQIHGLKSLGISSVKDFSISVSQAYIQEVKALSQENVPKPKIMTPFVNPPQR